MSQDKLTALPLGQNLRLRGSPKDPSSERQSTRGRCWHWHRVSRGSIRGSKLFHAVILSSIDNCATSIWLLDVRELAAPTARLEGFDISLDAVPPAETLPSNVKFRHWDVKQDLPQDLVGVFDIVHLRSLSFVLLNSQVPNVVERLFKMLS